MTFYRHNLDHLASGGCSAPGCTHEHAGEPLFLHPRCHVGGRLEAIYKAGSGVLVLACRECHRVVAQIAVAQAPGVN